MRCLPVTTKPIGCSEERSAPYVFTVGNNRKQEHDMTERSPRAGLQIATPLANLVEDEILPGTGLDADHLWRGFARLLAELTPVNRELLAKRDQLQGQLDNWHRANPGP